MFARLYPRISRSAEQSGGTGHRRSLLAGLEGRVIEVGAGHGLNFAHYPGTVSEVVYLGTSTSYNVTTSIGAEVVVFLQNAHGASDAAGRGDVVWLSWDPAHSYAIGSPV